MVTSRQRTIDTLSHCQPDRTVIDFSSHRSSGIAAIAYDRLRKYLGLPYRPPRVHDMVQQLAIVDADVLDIFGVDVIEMGRVFLNQESDWTDWILPDGTPCKIPYYIHVEKRGDAWVLLDNDECELGVQRPGCLYFEQTYWPLENRDLDEFDLAELPTVLGKTIWTATPHPGAHLPLTESGLAQMRKNAEALRQSTDRAIVGLFGGNLFELPQWLFRMDKYLTYMALYPEKAEALSSALCDIHIGNLKKWLGAVGSSIDVILFGDDLGGQNGPLISPAMYRRFFKPYHRKLWTLAKQLAPIKVMLHCCGGIYPLLNDLLDAGLDIVNPVQISCADMAAKDLKSEFGNRLVFWGGGCDTRNVLPHGSEDEIRRHVQQQVYTLNKGGGFVFQQVHNIMANMPPENIVAMFEAVRKI